MVRLSRLLVLALILSLITGCANDVCITPEEIYTESTSIVMHAYPKEPSDSEKKDKPWLELGWIKAGFRHNANADINLKTSGNANMCGISKDELEASSKIPLDQTNDAYFTIDYSTAQQDINVNMQVLKGDLVSFHLDKIRVPIDCNNPQSNVNIRDKDACMNGTEIDVKGQKIKIDKYQGSSIGVDYGSSKTKPSNFVFRSMPYNWIAGGENGAYDVIVPMSTNDLDKQDCNTMRNNRDKYSAYIINRICGFFCSDTSDMINGNCVLGLMTDSDTQKIDNKAELRNQYLPSIAKFYIQKDSHRHTMTVDPVLKIDTPYKVDNSGSLFATRLSKFYALYGGFKLKVKRDCSQRAYNSLYLYISDTPPNAKPSDQNAIRVSSLKDIAPKGNIKTANTGMTHSYMIDKTLPLGDIYLGFDTDGDIIENNTGKINVTLGRPRVLKGAISKGIMNTRDSILNLVQGKHIDKTTGLRSGGASDEIYSQILRNVQFRMIIYAIVSLFVMMQGIFYFTGIAPLTKEAVIISILKVAIVMSLMAPATAAVYRNFLQSIFINGMDYIINITTSFNKGFSTKTDFNFIDSSLGRFTIHETWVQVLALFLSGPLGWLALFCILVSLAVYGFVAIKAIVLYLMSLILIVFLTALMPLFILTLLFKFTSRIFHTWIKILVTNMIKPILIFITLAILNQLMMSAFFDVFNFSVCDDCILSFRIFAELGLFCILSGPVPVGYDPVLTFEEKAKRASAMFQTTLFTLPVKMEDLFFMVFIAFAAKIMAERSATMASSITGTFGGSIGFHTVAGMMDSAMGLIGMDKESRDRRARSLYQSAMSKKADLTATEKDALKDTGAKRADGSRTNASNASATRISKPNDLDMKDSKRKESAGAKDLDDLLDEPIDPYDGEEIYDEINDDEMDDISDESRDGIDQAGDDSNPAESSNTEDLSDAQPKDTDSSQNTADTSDNSNTPSKDDEEKATRSTIDVDNNEPNINNDEGDNDLK
ncbi:type IV secretion system protein VirB6 [Candidatus Xenohaliotis californiensis]|uniref:Type IV secretion system protein VirB6 n=1 Tax=Candidatus Xenohaliotis californiensis TaxID=84677 RepID=A0ABM9N872_9RICK|nr:type IV secretion system protein VirB6 [Candidatus Xenohaliotis californiensis]